MTIVHLVPGTVLDPALRSHGTTKDVRNRQEYFRARKLAVRQVAAGRDEASVLAAAVAAAPGADVLLIDVPGPFPRLARSLKRRWPRLRLIARVFNAEFPHRLDWARASSSARDVLWGLKSAAAGLWGDARFSRAIDEAWIITGADASYWRRLAGPAKVRVVPYFSPDALPAAAPSKTDECVCLGAVVSNPFIEDAVRGFVRTVEGLKGGLEGWRFTVTGSRTKTPLSRRVEWLGLVEETGPVLARARAMALLSDFGRGFKTKILDAIRAGAWVLVPPGLFARLPEEVRPWCAPVRPGDPAAFRDALESPRRFPAGDPNAVLRAQSFAAMDESLRGH